MSTEPGPPDDESIPWQARRQGELPLLAPAARDDELLVPARMVNEWIYCPRLAFNNGELGPADFVSAAGGCNLKPGGPRRLISAYERRLDQVTTHPVFGYQVSMRRLLHVQARLLARWFLGEFADYPHYVPRLRMARRSNEERAYVVAYDIGDPKRWRRVFKLMHGYGRWLQLSLFRCRLDGSRRVALAMALESLIDPAEDHVVILDLGPAATVEFAVESLGKSFQAIERRAIVV